MINYNTVQDIYNRNFGSELFYKRAYYHNMIYTEGINDFATTLNAQWFIDLVISHMPEVIKVSNDNDERFFVAEIQLNQTQEGKFEIFREGYINGEYEDRIIVTEQTIPYIDLPPKTDESITSYKFYLILSRLEPIQFTLMLKSEY